jgi:hypothetical protein
MYIGRAVQEQVKIIESYNQEVWFISAGLGILNGGPGAPIIPSYEASFSVKGAGPSFKQWTEMHSSSIAKLASKTRILLLIPKPYLRALEPSIVPFAKKIITFDRSSILVENGARVIDLHPRIREVLQCAASDYWTEILRLVLPEEGKSKELKELNRKASELPERMANPRVSDSDLLQIIRSLPESVTSAQKAVRHIRDVENIAASQERISYFWKMRSD